MASVMRDLTIPGPSDIDEHLDRLIATAAEEEAFRELCTRSLAEVDGSHLVVETLYVKTHEGGRARYETVAFVHAVDDDTGRWEPVGMSIGDSEEKRFWGRLFLSLRARHLTGVRLITSEEHGGLREALAIVYPEAECRWGSERRLFPHGFDAP